jgi:hypothetical protein
VNSYTSISKKQEKKLTQRIIFIVISILTAVFIFNIFINPYGNAYIQVKKINVNSITPMGKFEKLKLLKNKDFNFNSFVIGSSQISRYYAEDLDNDSKDEWISFPIGTSMASEHYHYMKFFTENFKINKILYGIEDSNIFGKYILRGNTIQNKKEEYNLLDYLTFDTLKKSIDKINYNRKEINKLEQISNIKYQYFNGWNDRNISKQRLDAGLTIVKPNNIKSISSREGLFLEKISKEFGTKIIPIISFYHPYVLLMKKKENYINFLSTTLKYFDSVWHINPKYINEVLSHKYYFDNSHTNRLFGKRVVKSIMDKDDFFIQINKETYVDIIDNIFTFSCKQDFSKYTYDKMIECK